MGVMKYELDSIDESVVTLDSYNSDLNLVIDASKYNAQPLTKEGFAFMWAGARATHGAEKGKICFEVKIIEHLDVSHLPSDEPNPHVVRVGFSVDSTTMQLGEEPQSYGYGGTGKVSTNCQFKDFGPSFMAGDCILAVVNLDSDPIEMGFAKNGNFIGWAFKIKKVELEGKALFPHVLTKNCSFEVNFGQKEKPFFSLPDVVKDYIFISCVPVDQKIAGSRCPEKREDCEMIMMCGLPGAGKSVWATEYSKKNPEKKYNILGTNNIIDKMKVMGLPRKRNYHGRWDVLIQMATKCLNTMFSIGSKLRRNYILDQTNVYPTAQRRKMRNFDGFKRKAVVIVPTEEEYKRRCDKRDREEGKEIPDEAVLEMKANFKIPEVNDIFDDVTFIELQREDAEKLVKNYNDEGKAAVGSRKHFRPNESPRDKGYGGYDSRRGDKNDSSISSHGEKGDSKRFRSREGRSRDEHPHPYRGSRGGRGTFESRRGFGSSRGGYAERGSYPDSPRNFGERGAYDSGSPRNFGERAYDGNRGGYDNRDFGNVGGYGGQYGGYDNREFGGRAVEQVWEPYNERDTFGSGVGGFSDREGYGSMSRGGYDSGRGRGRGSFDTGRGAFNTRVTSERMSDFNPSQTAQDYNRSGRFEQDQKMYGRDRTDEYPSRGYQGYSDSSAKFNENIQSDYNRASDNFNIRGGSRGAFSGSGRGGYDVAERSNYTEQQSERSYGGNLSGDYSNRGSSAGRYQHGNRGSSSRGSNFQGSRNNSFTSGGNRTGSVDASGNYSNKDYGYASGSSYGGSSRYYGNTESYATRTTPGFTSGPQKADPVQRPGVSSMDKFTSGSTRPSGARTRWSAETAQAPATASDSSYVTYKSAETYSSGGSQSYTYPQNFNQNNVPSTGYQGKQTYGYQQGMASNINSQSWPGSSTGTASVSNPASNMSGQSSWLPYGQQSVTSNQYYSQ